MKKLIVAIILFSVLVTVISAGEITKSRLLGLDGYVPLFIGNAPQPNTQTKIEVESRYIRAARTDENYKTFCELSGDIGLDTYLEFALASYYSPAVVQIRPVEADNILPANNPRLSGLKLGAAVYKELVELRFLDPRNTAAIGRYENMLKFICDKNGVTRAEIEAYYRDGIRSLVAEIVSEEFNKINFVMESPTGGYNASLARNQQNGHYTLRYTYAIDNTKDLSANSLKALTSAMSKNTAEFNRNSVNTVDAQALLIPAVVYADWKQKGVAGGVDALALITEAVTNFYLNPTNVNYEAIRGIYARYYALTISDDVLATSAIYSFSWLMNNLNPELMRKMHREVSPDLVTTAKIPNDRRYDVFSTRWGR